MLTNKQYNKYVAQADKLGVKHMSRKWVERNYNTLKLVNPKDTYIYKHIAENQIYINLDKAGAKKLVSKLSKVKGSGKTLNSLKKLTKEELGHYGLKGLTDKQKSKLSDILSKEYQKYKDQGMKGKEAGEAVSHFWFGSK